MPTGWPDPCRGLGHPSHLLTRPSEAWQQAKHTVAESSPLGGKISKMIFVDKSGHPCGVLTPM